jgi:hypothetical protein
MKKITYKIAILLVSAFFGLAGCSGSSDDSSDGTSGGSGNTAAEEEIVYVVSKVFESLEGITGSSSISGGSNVIINAALDSCITTSPSPVTDISSFSVTYTNCSFSDSDVVASGTLNFTSSVSGSTITIEMDGTITGTGGTISSMVFDLTIVAPWDATNTDFAGEPTSITGTITADGTSHNAADITWSDDGSSTAVTDPHFVVAGQTSNSKSYIIYSENGSAWGSPNVAEITSVAASFKGIACDSTGNCVAVGENGAVFYSTNGTSWTAGTSNISIDLTGVTVGNTRWVAVSATSIIYSDDAGANWSDTNTIGSTIIDVAYGSDTTSTKWVAIAENTSCWMSDDGISWTALDLNSVPQNDGWMKSITFGNGYWVAVGENGMTYWADDPSDAANWTAINYGGTENLWGVAFGEGDASGSARFVAVGSSSSPVLLVSDDHGQSWSTKSLPSDFPAANPLKDAAYGNGRWSVLGNYGDHLLSTDYGATWSAAALDKYGAYAIAYRP